MKTLADISSGERCIVEDINGGATFTSRVTAMGFTPRAEVLVVQQAGRGPVITYLRDTQVALGRGMARRISVRSMK